MLYFTQGGSFIIGGYTVYMYIYKVFEDIHVCIDNLYVPVPHSPDHTHSLANPPPLLPHLSTNHVTHISTQSSSRQQLCLYDANPSRVQQKTAIYELSEVDSIDDGGEREDMEYDPPGGQGDFFGTNGKSVHVVVTQDPNYLDNGGGVSD